jgi:hypothetical protein
MLVAVARSFRDSVGRFHFFRVAVVLPIGSATSERVIIRVALDNVTPKNGEKLGGLCLDAHDHSPLSQNQKCSQSLQL